jgi:hypothetical protein
MKQLTEFKNVPQDGEVKAAMQLPHPGDAHLWDVLVKMSDTKWVIWTYNDQTAGYGQGHYFVRPLDAAQSEFYPLQLEAYATFALTVSRRVTMQTGQRLVA